MSQFDDELKRYEVTCNLLNLLSKLRVETVSASTENEKRHNWATVARLMGNLEMDMFSHFPFSENDPSAQEKQDVSALARFLKLLHIR